MLPPDGGVYWKLTGNLPQISPLNDPTRPAAGLTRLAIANANETPAVVLVQYVEEGDGA